MPITFPAGICVSGARLRPVNAVAVQSSPFTLRRSVQVFPGQRWELELDILPSDRAGAAAVEALVTRLRGGAETVRLGDPFRALPLGSPSGSPVFNATTAVAGSDEIPTTGWTPSTSGLLLTGDLVSLGDQLYTLLEDVTSDADGKATLQVWPALRSLPQHQSPVVTTDPTGVFALANQPGFARSGSEIYTTETLQFIEHVQGDTLPAAALTYNGAALTYLSDPLTHTA